MKTAKENAQRIRAGGKLMLLVAAAVGVALLAQVAASALHVSYEQSQYLVAIIDIILFLAFIGGGVGLWLAFSGIADELEASP